MYCLVCPNVSDGSDGCFLVRPSFTDNPLTLSLVYRWEVSNINIRQRDDKRFALGYSKPSEKVNNLINPSLPNGNHSVTVQSKIRF